MIGRAFGLEATTVRRVDRHHQREDAIVLVDIRAIQAVLRVYFYHHLLALLVVCSFTRPLFHIERAHLCFPKVENDAADGQKVLRLTPHRD